MRFVLLLILFSGIYQLNAQQNDSLVVLQQSVKLNDEKHHPESLFKTRLLLMPLALISYGSISRSNEELVEFDTYLKEEISENTGFHTTIDNYLQYAPGIAVYAMNAAGIKGLHNFWDRTFIYLLSNTIMGVTVTSLKSITKEMRPDGSAANSFPSGHTANAFAGAEFLHQEYKNKSPWYGIAGYTVASATGILRMYNNKHWLRDIVAGAGIGILSTELAYSLEPVIAKRIFHKKTSYHFDPANF